MIEKITYDDLNKIITILEDSSNNIKNMISLYNDGKTNTVLKMERYIAELTSYIEYLKNLYGVNIDADEALKRIRELSGIS